MFSTAGVEAFAERARRELLATGETARARTAKTRDDLTPQETQIARLAGDGLSNPEIGARLYISPRTVEWHLHKVCSQSSTSAPAGSWPGRCPRSNRPPSLDSEGSGGVFARGSAR
jgi:DNA-binding CsgD family transcriptional regulator